MDISYILMMKDIERMNGRFKLRQYNLMEHSYGVTALFFEFAQREGINIDLQDVKFVLNHDILEVVTTDLVWPVKNHSEKTKEAWEVIENEVLLANPDLEPYCDKAAHQLLGSLKHKLFKVCDLLDLWLFCQREKECGNNSVEIREIILNCENMLNGKFSTVTKYMEDYLNERN